MVGFFVNVFFLIQTVFPFSDVSLFYYFLAAEAGLEVGSFNVAWLCEENKVVLKGFLCAVILASCL